VGRVAGEYGISPKFQGQGFGQLLSPGESHMPDSMVSLQTYAALESAVLLVHLFWILWILLGWMVTRGWLALTWLHIASLL
jgi:hypothetical protein